MTQAEKGAAYRFLKEAGVTFTRHYRDYTEAELVKMVEQIKSQPAHDNEMIETWAPDADLALANHEPALDGGLLAAQAAEIERLQAQLAAAQTPPPQVSVQPQPAQEPLTMQKVLADAEEREVMAGEHLNTKDENEPLFTDDQGLIWYQVEVAKSATAKPRGRRVLDYVETGVVKQTIHDGQYTETFEMPGQARRAAQVKITLPSYQVGIYRDPNLPFRVHTYNGQRCYDFFEVCEYYGGADLVPGDIKRVYVSTTLGFDIATTNRAIQAEARRLGILGGM